jgi:hypothetical protein
MLQRLSPWYWVLDLGLTRGLISAYSITENAQLSLAMSAAEQPHKH